MNSVVKVDRLSYLETVRVMAHVLDIKGEVRPKTYIMSTNNG